MKKIDQIHKAIICLKNIKFKLQFLAHPEIKNRIAKCFYNFIDKNKLGKLQDVTWFKAKYTSSKYVYFDFADYPLVFGFGDHFIYRYSDTSRNLAKAGKTEILPLEPGVIEWNYKPNGECVKIGTKWDMLDLASFLQMIKYLKDQELDLQ